MSDELRDDLDTPIEFAPEVWRLTTALHANRCHPDYNYIVAPAEVSNPTMLEQGGWERNPVEVLAPGDECWRRRKQP